MRPLLLALLLLFFAKQLLDISAPAIMKPSEKDEKEAIFAIFDFVFLATIGLAMNLEYLKELSEDLFWIGILGMGQMSFGWFVIGIKDPILLYMFSFFISIGPVFSVCLIVEKQIPDQKTHTFWTYLVGFFVIMMDQLPREVLVMILFVGSAYVACASFESLGLENREGEDEQSETDNQMAPGPLHLHLGPQLQNIEEQDISMDVMMEDYEIIN